VWIKRNSLRESIGSFVVCVSSRSQNDSQQRMRLDRARIDPECATRFGFRLCGVSPIVKRERMKVRGFDRVWLSPGQLEKSLRCVVPAVHLSVSQTEVLPGA